MIVTYAEGDGEPRVWDFDPDEVPQSQAEIIEKRYGRGTGMWAEWCDDVRQGGARARRILLWHLLRQDHHTLRFEDTPDFKMGQVKVGYSLDELNLIRGRVIKSNMSGEEREQALTALDLEITEQMGDVPPDDPDPAEPEPVSPGKASKSSG